MSEGEKMVAFLHEAARYFGNRPTSGEDAAHWANVYNAANCTKAAEMLEEQAAEIADCMETIAAHQRMYKRLMLKLEELKRSQHPTTVIRP